MNVGKGVFNARVEGNIKGMKVIFLPVGVDSCSEGSWPKLYLDGLVDTLLLILQVADLLKQESHNRVGMR